MRSFSILYLISLILFNIAPAYDVFLVYEYHIVFSPKYRRQIIYGKIKQDVGRILRQLCEYKGVEKNKKAIENHIRTQLQGDITYDQLSFREYIDPFTGEKINK